MRFLEALDAAIASEYAPEIDPDDDDRFEPYDVTEEEQYESFRLSGAYMDMWDRAIARYMRTAKCHTSFAQTQVYAQARGERRADDFRRSPEYRRALTLYCMYHADARRQIRECDWFCDIECVAFEDWLGL